MKERCTNCRYFYAKSGKVNWITYYCCTVDGVDRVLGKFDDYVGGATNKAHIELSHRCCRFFKERDM